MSHITLFARVARAPIATVAIFALGGSSVLAKSPVPPTAGVPSTAATAPAAPSTRTIRHIVVVGTQRIEPATVLSYISIREGDVYNEQTSDLALKTLYQTGLFADVKVKFDGTNLTVSVIENPILNQIEFEGNSKVSQKDLEKEVQLKPRTVQSPS